jgi:hypothetical protein
VSREGPNLVDWERACLRHVLESRGCLSKSTSKADDLPVNGEKIGSKVHSQGQMPQGFDEGAEGVAVTRRNGEAEQGAERLEESSEMEVSDEGSCSGPSNIFGHNLSADQIRRYSRQLLVPSFGVAGYIPLPRSY